MTLLVATTNLNKLKEVHEALQLMAPHKGAPYDSGGQVRAPHKGAPYDSGGQDRRAPLYGAPFEILTLADVPPVPEPEETGATFWENARIKALAYSQATGLVAVAEDSGLVIDALDGQPGVHSARFLGPDATYPDRFAAIYRRLRSEAPAGGARPTAAEPKGSSLSLSSARFVTALAVADGTSLLFETECTIEGTIAPAPAGENGFGYDPIFFYPPLGRTTAQLTVTQKSSVSHRARAFRDLARFLPRLDR